MSREIDRLIAEKVMGWIPFIDSETTESYCQPPFYSTDIKAAWEVYEKIYSSKSGEFLVGRNPYITNTDISYVVGYMGYDCIEIYAEADTMSKAICLAALKAVGVEI